MPNTMCVCGGGVVGGWGVQWCVLNRNVVHRPTCSVGLVPWNTALLQPSVAPASARTTSWAANTDNISADSHLTDFTQMLSWRNSLHSTLHQPHKVSAPGISRLWMPFASTSLTLFVQRWKNFGDHKSPTGISQREKCCWTCELHYSVKDLIVEIQPNMWSFPTMKS